MMYLNGQPLTLWQKLVMGVMSVASLIFMFTFGLVIVVVGLIIGAFIFVTLWWKMRKIKQQFAQQQPGFEEQLKAQMNPSAKKKSAHSKAKDAPIEGSFREL